jgi:hypothetical protein
MIFVVGRGNEHGLCIATAFEGLAVENRGLVALVYHAICY